MPSRTSHHPSGPYGPTPRTSFGLRPASCAARGWTTRRSPELSASPRLGLPLGTRPAHTSAAELRGMPEAFGRRRTPLLGGRAARFREARRAAVREGAAAEIGELTNREILIAGAIAYWCEGTESKPYRTQRPRRLHEQRPVADPVLPAVPRHGRDSPDRPDIPCLRPWRTPIWNRPSGSGWRYSKPRPISSSTPTLKRHNPKTVRKNVGDTYHGCLRIDVRRSTGLYRQIEGWARAITRRG